MPLRIVRPGYKVLYVAGMGAVGYGLSFVLGLIDPSGVTRLILGFVVGNALWILAVRSFRVAKEDVVAPRPLWRLTGRPRAGFWLVAFHLAGIVSTINTGITLSPHASRFERLDYAPGIVALNVVVDLAWAAAYLNSSLRLRALARAATPLTGATGSAARGSS